MVDTAGLAALFAPAGGVANAYLKQNVDRIYEQGRTKDILSNLNINIDPAVLQTSQEANPDNTEDRIRQIAIQNLLPSFNETSARTFAQNVLAKNSSINITNDPEGGGQPLGGGLFLSLGTKITPTTEAGKNRATYNDWLQFDVPNYRKMNSGMSESQVLVNTFANLSADAKIQVEQYARKGHSTEQKLKEELAEGLGLLRRTNQTSYGFEYGMALDGDRIKAFRKKYTEIAAMQGNAGSQISAILNTPEVQAAYVNHLARVINGDEQATALQQAVVDQAEETDRKILATVNNSIYGDTDIRDMELPVSRPDNISPDILDKINNINIEELRENFKTVYSGVSSDEALRQVSIHFANQYAAGDEATQVFIEQMLRSKLDG